MRFKLLVKTKYAEPGIYNVLRKFGDDRVIIYLTPLWSSPRQLTIVRTDVGEFLERYRG